MLESCYSGMYVYTGETVMALVGIKYNLVSINGSLYRKGVTIRCNQIFISTTEQ